MSNGHTLLLLLIPCVLGMRDPFEPPEDRCSVAQLTSWHYRGWISNGEKITGIVLDPSGKWLRINEGQKPGTQWTVSAISAGQMDITLSAGCEPRQWRWIKEGAKNESKDNATAHAADNQRQGEGTASLADGG